MELSDETLNAFLDGELSALEMRIVRDAMASNEQIAQRLDHLAWLNSQVQASAHELDAIALSPGLEALTAQLKEQAREAKTGNILDFPKKTPRSAFSMVWQGAVAASVAAVFGFMVGTATQTGVENQALPEWAAISRALSDAPSGETLNTETGTRFEARLSFMNTEGDYCRQFYVKPAGRQALQSIACRSLDGWSLSAALPAGDTNGYQPASEDRSLDKVIDSMLQGELLDAEQEQRLIKQQWKP